MSTDPESRSVNHEKLFKYVTKYTAAFWGTSFVNELVRIKADEDSKRFASMANSGEAEA